MNPGDVFEKALQTAFEKKEIEEELAKGPIPVPGPDEQDWTAAKVMATLVNPVYTGVGPYPRIIEDELWIGAVGRLIENMGSDLVLRVLLDSLRQALDEECEPYAYRSV